MLLYPNSRAPIPQRPRANTQFETYIFLIIVFVSSKLPAKLLIFIGFPPANILLFSVFLRDQGDRTIPEFQLHTKDRQKDIVRDEMRELGAGPRQMVRVCGLTYAVVYKMWKDL